VSERLRQTATEIFRHALEVCSIERAFGAKVRVQQRRESRLLMVDGVEAVAMDGMRRVRVLALGKAGVPMLEALLRTKAFDGCDFGGAVIAPEPPKNAPREFAWCGGGHPVPNAASFAGARAALTMAQDAARDAENTLCVWLISGGGSSMMELPLSSELPVHEAIGLEDTIAFHRGLVASGAGIVEMNCVRKHFSAVKGGRLAKAAGAARQISLLVSDVPLGRLDALASGPTIPDPSTCEDCREIVGRYRMQERFPAAVRDYFAGDFPETPKPGELKTNEHVLLSSKELGEAARQQAEALGFATVVDNTCDDWPYERAAEYLLERMREMRRRHARVCVISTGEVTVRLPSDTDQAGRGGRNQQWALYAALRLRADDGSVAVLSAGSDGIDGNSAAAGAVVDRETLRDCEAAEKSLRSFDAYGYLTERGAALMTGATGQNLRDLRILLADSSG
jgi:glycerate 2-kinase